MGEPSADNQRRRILSPFSEHILHREQLISPSARILIKPFGARMLIEAVRKALDGGA